jgi:hypothetical protein
MSRSRRPPRHPLYELVGFIVVKLGKRTAKKKAKQGYDAVGLLPAVIVGGVVAAGVTASVVAALLADSDG